MSDLRDNGHLQGWTPIGFESGDEPRLRWADLRACRFDQPLFRRTLEAWNAQGAQATETTGLGALSALDSLPSMDPSVIIAHASCCGSTLLARMLSAMDDAILVSEPRLVAEILVFGVRASALSHEAVLRQAVRALGRIRFGNERRYVLKLSSTLTRFLPTIRLAFPDVPMIWLQRRPEEIISRWLRSPGSWFSAMGLEGDDLVRAILRRQTAVFLAAHRHVRDSDLILDYTDLPDAVWNKVIPFMGMAIGECERRKMEERTQFHSKTDKPFAPTIDPELAPWIVDAIRQGIDPLYLELNDRR